MVAVPCGNVKKKFPVVAKMMALVIAMVMVLSMSIAVFADGETPAEGGETPAATTTYAITVDTSDDAVTHTYKVYQIFTGTPSDGKLTAIKYGSSYAGKTAGAAVPKTELDAIGTTSDSVRTWIANTFGNGIATASKVTTYGNISGTLTSGNVSRIDANGNFVSLAGSTPIGNATRVSSDNLEYAVDRIHYDPVTVQAHCYNSGRCKS